MSQLEVGREGGGVGGERGAHMSVQPSVKPCDYMSVKYVLFERQLYTDTMYIY